MTNNSISTVAHRAMKKFGRISTMSIGCRMGEFFPFFYVIEYPKSGGTWLGKMLSVCLDTPFPQFPIFPIGFSAIIHSHIKYNHRLKRVIYLVRDGRDVMVSYYFHRYRLLSTEYRGACLEWMKNVYGKEIDMGDSSAHLPRFIEYEMQNPSITQLNWPDHVNDWLGKTDVTCVKYEDLLTDGSRTLEHICKEISDKIIDTKRIDSVIEMYSFTNITKRKAGVEDRSSFLRKGIAGDWKNYFDLESAAIFNKYAGDTLIKLGYECDDSWVNNLKRYPGLK